MAADGAAEVAAAKEPEPTAEEKAAAKAAELKAKAELKALVLANKKLEARRQEVKSRLKKEQEAARRNEKLAEERKATARRDVWQNVRLVACTASSALQVSRRLQRDMVEEGGRDVLEKAGVTRDDPLTFDFVILDEAAAMMEPDAIGCLLHGAGPRCLSATSSSSRRFRSGTTPTRRGTPSHSWHASRARTRLPSASSRRRRRRAAS